MKTLRKYGQKPYKIGLLHGGPGASGEMKPVAEYLSNEVGTLEFLQTKRSVHDQIEELHKQIISFADYPVSLVGHSWGAWLGFLFAGRYPELVKKLILIGAGAFDNKYNQNLMNIRLDRLDQHDQLEAERLMAVINSGRADNNIMREFGRLMTIADSCDYLPVENDSVDFDIEIHRAVWAEASAMRETGVLLNHAERITIPVVALHGDCDPHPVDGVREPLSERLADFRMIVIKDCGHTPWRERYAKDVFYEILRNELKQG